MSKADDKALSDANERAFRSLVETQEGLTQLVDAALRAQVALGALTQALFPFRLAELDENQVPRVHWLRRLRAACGLSQKAFGEAVGIAQSRISAIERGDEQRLRPREISAIVDVFGEQMEAFAITVDAGDQ